MHASIQRPARVLSLILLVSLVGSLLLGACANVGVNIIPPDGGGGGDGGSNDNFLNNQFLFVILIIMILFVAMIAVLR